MTDEAETTPAVEHNESKSRFEAQVDGDLAVASYVRDGDRMTFNHTSVPTQHEGRGIGNALAREALEFASREKVSVVPQCEFIAAYIEKHPEYQHLVRQDSSGT